MINRAAAAEAQLVDARVAADERAAAAQAQLADAKDKTTN